jgi:hypothetical protein
MKTLIYTSIYSYLWGTEFGGRPSRERHYRLSLKKILELNANKYICFVPQNELDDLTNFFYVKNNISKDKLEFIVFELTQTKYFEQIRNLKNIEVMKTIDRCFEIQYNKFFWYDLLPNKESYDRVYWFDAGLSHGGLFPEDYRIDSSYEGFFGINLFVPNFLDYINNLTNEKFLLVGKNNTGQFFWSQTLPSNYYTNYDNSTHVIGGFFGGKPNIFNEFKQNFEGRLVELLNNENQLFMEELILSNLYVENKDKITLLEFDDWYEREHHKKEDKIKYFYNLFLI